MTIRSAASNEDESRWQIEIRPAGPDDRTWLADRLRERWGSTNVVSRGRLHDAPKLPALVALRDEERVGATTYRPDGGACEVVTLDAFLRRQGVGSALLDQLVEVARAAGCRRLWLITTNDNISALRFYQLRGLRLVAVHRDAVAGARTLKPEIPLLGQDEIPIHDELELELRLD